MWRRDTAQAGRCSFEHLEDGRVKIILTGPDHSLFYIFSEEELSAYINNDKPKGDHD